jgi:hypothetical protein
MTLPERIAELKRLEAEATPGPWHAVNYADTWICIQDGPDYSDADVFKSGEDDRYKSFLSLRDAEANGAFTVAARNTVPDLIAGYNAALAALAACHLERDKLEGSLNGLHEKWLAHKEQVAALFVAVGALQAERDALAAKLAEARANLSKEIRLD